MTDVHVRWTAGADDLLAMNLRMVEERLHPRFLWRDGTILVGIAAAGLVVILMAGAPVLYRVLVPAALFATTLYAFPRVRAGGLRRQLRGLAQRQRLAEQLASMELEADASGMRQRCNDGPRREISWEHVSAIEEDDHGITVVGRGGDVLRTPWSAFDDEATRQSLLDLLERHAAFEAWERTVAAATPEPPRNAGDGNDPDGPDGPQGPDDPGGPKGPSGAETAARRSVEVT